MSFVEKAVGLRVEFRGQREENSPLSTAVMPSLSFSELVDFLLLRLFELERAHGAGAYASLNDIAKELKDEIPVAWVMDAGKVLQARQLASCAFMLGGHAKGRITGEGRLWVENEQGGIRKVKEDRPHITVNVTGSSDQVAVSGGDRIQTTQALTIEKEREPAFKLLDEIESQLEGDATLDAEARQDYLTDLGMVRGQLRKREPNRPALAALLAPLSQVGSVATRVADLVGLLNP